MPRVVVFALVVVVGAGLLGCGQSAPKPETQAGRKNVQAGLWITDPPDGAAVMMRPYMTGTVSDTTVQVVWLVVRAVGTPGYWVQPPAPVRPDGMWVAQPYIGLPETASGVRFEVKAFANPAAELASGIELKDWPAAQWTSNLVTVSRQ